MFYLSMAKIAKRLPSTNEAKIRTELCDIVSEAEMKQMETRTPSFIYPVSPHLAVHSISKTGQCHHKKCHHCALRNP
jgi:hypothetical protein